MPPLNEILTCMEYYWEKKKKEQKKKTRKEIYKNKYKLASIQRRSLFEETRYHKLPFSHPQNIHLNFFHVIFFVSIKCENFYGVRYLQNKI